MKRTTTNAWTIAIAVPVVGVLAGAATVAPSTVAAPSDVRPVSFAQPSTTPSPLLLNRVDRSVAVAHALGVATSDADAAALAARAAGAARTSRDAERVANAVTLTPAEQRAAKKAAAKAAKQAERAAKRAAREAKREAAELAQQKRERKARQAIRRLDGKPGKARALGRHMASLRGWTGYQWDALERLWSAESGWQHDVGNPSSGAYGIPQALPASKMGSAGADWATNPRTQIRWGLNYIEARWGTPAGAYAHFQANHWY